MCVAKATVQVGDFRYSGFVVRSPIDLRTEDQILIMYRAELSALHMHEPVPFDEFRLVPNRLFDLLSIYPARMPHGDTEHRELLEYFGLS